MRQSTKSKYTNCEASALDTSNEGAALDPKISCAPLELHGLHVLRSVRMSLGAFGSCEVCDVDCVYDEEAGYLAC